MRSILPLFVLALATPALATDGVLEINQTCAVETGCFPGDAPGFPVTADGSAGKSYLLTSDLTLPDANTTGVEMGSDVALDLNNFAIVGPVVCLVGSGGLECDPAGGSGSGVTASPTGSTASVKNGTITGMGADGVALCSLRCEVSNIHVRSNGRDGIAVGVNSKVTGSTAIRNGRSGIRAGSGSTLAVNTVSGNGDDGIAIGEGSTITGNTSYQNYGDGIDLGPGSSVVGNTASENQGDGIAANVAATLSQNTAYGNWGDGISTLEGATVSDNTVYGNRGDGVQAGSGSNVSRNGVRQNFGYGLNLESTASYRENTITTDAVLSTGTVLGGVDAGANVCNGSLTCP